MKRILTMLLLTLVLAGCEIKVTPYSKPVNSFWTLDSNVSLLTNYSLDLRGIITDNRRYYLSSDFACDYSIRLDGSRSAGAIEVDADCFYYSGTEFSGVYYIDKYNKLSIVWPSISITEYYR